MIRGDALPCRHGNPTNVEQARCMGERFDQRISMFQRRVGLLVRRRTHPGNRVDRPGSRRSRCHGSLRAVRIRRLFFGLPPLHLSLLRYHLIDYGKHL